MSQHARDSGQKNAVLARALARGEVWVMPTDTIYGIVGSALNRRTVTRIYRLRKRNHKKPMIILIGAFRDLSRFGIKPDVATRRILSRFWPGPVSIILPLPSRASVLKQFHYLHRGTNALAFRLPAEAPRAKAGLPKNWLRAMLKKTGPLVASSANHEGKPPAKTIAEAKAYFGKNVDGYLNKGTLRGKPSKLVKIDNGKMTILR